MGITLNPCDTHSDGFGHTTLTNGDLTITASSALTVGQARGTYGQSSGKYYFEFHLDHFTTGNSIFALGILPLTTTLDGSPNTARIGAVLEFGASASGGGFNCDLWVHNVRELTNSGSVQFIAGHTNCFAVDLDNLLIWARTDDRPWNGDVLADPSTSTGGLSLATLVLPSAPMVMCNVFDTVTCDFGDQGFRFAPPSGFVAGWVGTGGTPGVDIPRDLSFVSKTTSSITLSWTAPTGPAPDSYSLAYKVTGAIGGETVLTGLSSTTKAVTGLSSGQSYDFRVQAVYPTETCGFTDTLTETTDGSPVFPNTRTLHRWRGQVGLNWLGLALVGDAFTNVVGRSDFDNFTEYGNTMRMLVTTPPVHKDRHKIFVKRFEIEVEAGEGLPGNVTAPVMMLDYSRDGGKTFVGLSKWRSMGRTGEYRTRLRWMSMGNSRQWVFRLQCTDPVRRQIIGTYIDDYEALA